MDSFISYIPVDRRLALSQGVELPDEASGAALFADISGFTPLTERLATVFGPGRGAEELSRHLNRVYDALISQLEYFGGSVISFAGDAIMCWFDAAQEDESARAVAAALAMQTVMRAFSTIDLGQGERAHLAMKTAVASGTARRFLVGDPQIQLIDTLAGQTIDRLAAAEKMANPGELLIDEVTRDLLSTYLEISEYREEAASGHRLAVVADFHREVAQTQWADLPTSLTQEQIRPWLITAVYEREIKGQGRFLTEIRPAAALFLRFTGLNYEDDPHVKQKLNDFIRRAQKVLANYGGTLLQLTIGDKGSYLYASFGALVAHEDDTFRAANAALELEKLPLLANTPVQIGISRGMMRVGSYGSHGRRTYGVLGDDVNLAARLMERATPGQILVSETVQRILRRGFFLEPVSEIQFRGKQTAVAVYELNRRRRPQTGLLQMPEYHIPLIGRQAEKELILQKIEDARTGSGQIVGLTAEAGMGKSRIVSEIVNHASEADIPLFIGECQSYGSNIPYLVWLPIWHRFFNLDLGQPIESQISQLENIISELASDRKEALPLLGEMLNLPIPENDFTESLEPQSRRFALESLLLTCLKSRADQAQAQNSLLIFVFEDLHWVDPVSHDLLENIAKLIVKLPVLFILAYRPPEHLRLQKPRLEVMPHFTHILLGELSQTEAEQLIREKLHQLFMAEATAVPPSLIQQITDRAQGSPFYVEELINYLHDRGTNLKDINALQNIELPTSLQSLILSRIDQLNEEQKLTLKIASIIGRLFRFNWLMGYYPELGKVEHVKQHLSELAILDLTPVDQPEPELVYMFKHIVTQEVTYASLPFATRALLHEQLGAYLESLDAERFVDMLAFHYERSENLVKKREYLEKAAEAAARRFANEEALDYLNRALALTPDDDSQGLYRLLQLREHLYNLLGERPKQQQDLHRLQRLTRDLRDENKEAEIALRQSRYSEMIGDYKAAAEAAQQALAMAQLGRKPSAQAAAYLQWGRVLFREAEYDQARRCFEHAHTLAARANVPDIDADCLMNIGNVAWSQGDLPKALQFYKQALTLKGEANNRRGESIILNNLGVAALSLGDYGTARTYYEQALEIMQAIGDRRNESFVLGNLGLVAAHLGQFSLAEQYQMESLQLRREMADSYGENLARLNLATIALYVGDHGRAQQMYEQILDAYQSSNNAQGEVEVLVYLSLLHHQKNEQEQTQALSLRAIELTEKLGLRQDGAVAWRNLGHAQAALGLWAEAEASYNRSLTMFTEIGNDNQTMEVRAGLARVALLQNDFDTAVVHVESILHHLQIGALYGTDEPLRIYLTCYRVLAAFNDERRHELLAEAYEQLQSRAQTIEDHDSRHLYLHQIPAHRELVLLYEATAVTD